MKQLLLEEFGNTTDWIAVVLVTITFLLLVLFLVAVLFFVFKYPTKEDDEKVELKQDKIEKMLDDQNVHIKNERYHERCKICGAEINKLSGKCNVCGKYNFEDNIKKTNIENQNVKSNKK